MGTGQKQQEPGSQVRDLERQNRPLEAVTHEEREESKKVEGLAELG